LPVLFKNLLAFLDREIIPGINVSQIACLLIVILFIFLISGKKILYISLTSASVLSLSVFFGGSIVSFIKNRFGLDIAIVSRYSPHYISLLITMLTVVTLATAIVSTIPIIHYEASLLRKMKGVSIRKKALLMGTRVFTHVIFTVIPVVILSRREEKYYKKASISQGQIAEEIVLEKGNMIKRRYFGWLLDYIHICLACICLSLEYIPIWAIEIDHLPTKRELKQRKE
jgi:hypothetical protein